MPRIKFNVEDLARMRPPEVGWHLFKVTDITEKLSGGKDSTNYYVTMEVIKSEVSDRNVGRTTVRIFNSKGSGFIVPFLASVWKVPYEEAVSKIAETVEGDSDIDLSSCIGEQVWNEIVEEEYKGRPQLRSSDNWAYGETPF